MNASAVASGAIGVALLVADVIAELLGGSVFTGELLTGRA
jgi:hypothetical protein